MAAKKPPVPQGRCPKCKGSGINRFQVANAVASRSTRHDVPCCDRCHGIGKVPMTSLSPEERAEL